MNHRSRQEINSLIDKYSFIPLFNPDDLNVSKKVLTAAYAGGVRLLELTNRSAQALAIFKEIIPFVHAQMPDLVVGAGTIMDEKSASEFYEAGAEFIVSPIVSAGVGKYCETNKVFWCPGAGTLTEIVNAHQLGADMVKIFPANLLGGPRFVEAIKGPCPWLRVMPTGGVEGTEENLQAWFNAGVACVGIGSRLFTREILAAGDYQKITTATKHIVGIISQLKSKFSL